MFYIWIFFKQVVYTLNTMWINATNRFYSKEEAHEEGNDIWLAWVFYKAVFLWGLNELLWEKQQKPSGACEGISVHS